MNDFLAFRKMITPMIIQILFWVLALVTVIMGLITIIQGEGLPGLVILILGPIMVRVYCELIILAFRIYESLRNIEIAKTGGKPATSQQDTFNPAQ